MLKSIVTDIYHSAICRFCVAHMSRSLGSRDLSLGSELEVIVRGPWARTRRVAQRAPGTGWPGTATRTRVLFVFRFK